MNVPSELKAATIGWLDMIAGRPDGGTYFNATTRGLARAVAFYVVIILLAVIFDGFFNPIPTAGGLMAIVSTNLLPLVAVAIVVFATTRALHPEVPFLALYVPAIYALGYILAIGVPMAIASGGLLSNVLLAVLGYMLYREARDIGKMKVGVSIAFAALSIVALVALPLALYMLTMPAAPAA